MSRNSGSRNRRGAARLPREAAGDPVDVRIDAIAAGGEGVGRLADGRVIFVHRTAPGEVAEVAVTEERPRWARGQLLRVLQPSPDRRDPPCTYYARCGGCTLEHLNYPAQLQAKARIVADALHRIGGLDIAPPEVVPSPAEFRYRNRVSFALRRLGTGRVVAGFHALGEPGRIVDMDGRCQLPEESIARVWDALRAAWGPNARLLPSGEQLRLTLRASAAGEVTLLIEGGFGPGSPGELLERVDGLVAIWHRRGETGSAAELVAGAPGLPDTWGDEAVELSGAAFLQVNRGAAELLEDHVFAAAGEVAGLRIVDAYCGIGLLARRFARAGAEVIGIELDPLAVAEAQRGAPPGACFEQGDVEPVLPTTLPADLVLLNPPRNGVAVGVVDALLATPPQRIIYVSCDPATLGRDLRRMGSAFAVTGVRSFDLFPQTAHVETVALLSWTDSYSASRLPLQPELAASPHPPPPNLGEGVPSPSEAGAGAVAPTCKPNQKPL